MEVFVSQFYRYQVKLLEGGAIVNVESYDPYRNPIGNPKGISSIKEDFESIKSLVDQIETGKLTPEILKNLGTKLYKALFPPEISNDFRSLLKRVEKEKSYLRLELDLDEEAIPTIATLPWELLHAPQEAGHPSERLGSHKRVIISRRRNQWISVEPIQLSQPLRIMLVVSNPQHDVIYEGIESSLNKLAESNLIDLPIKTLYNPDLQKLGDQLEELTKAGKEPHILHFIGHGRMKNGRGELCFVNSVSQLPEWVTDEDIAEILQIHIPNVILLQSCESGDLGQSLSGVASQMIQRGVPVVVAMQFPVSNLVATTFAEEFYRNLSKAEAIDVIIQKCRGLLYQKFKEGKESLSYANPVLFMQVQDGQLFKLKQTNWAEEAPNHDLLGVQPCLLPSFEKSITEKYPFPIAQACFDFNDETASIDKKFIAFDRIINHLTKYLAAIFIGQVQYDKNPDYPIPLRLLWMRHPTLDCWAKQLVILSKLYQRSEFKQQFLFPDILDACTQDLSQHPTIRRPMQAMSNKLNHPLQRIISVVNFLELLAEYRANVWQEGAASFRSDEALAQITLLLPALSAALEQMAPLTKYPLVYVSKADIPSKQIHLEFTQYMGRLLETVSPLPKPDNSIRLRRFYIADLEKGALLSLYPSFVLYQQEIYHLVHHASKNFVLYRSCARGVQFEPKPSDKSFFATLFEHESYENITTLNGALINDQDDGWKANIELSSTDERLDTIPWTWMSNEAREALEIGLGEALRIGRFWIGIEFLLMGLSKQEGCVLSILLKRLKVDPGTFRDLERQVIAGIVVSGAWKTRDPYTLGHSELPNIRLATTSTPVNIISPNRSTPAVVISPRFIKVLTYAHKLAKDSLITHKHLCLAALEEQNSIAVQWLFYIIYRESKLSHEQVLEQIQIIQSEVETSENNKNTAVPLSLLAKSSGINEQPALSPNQSILGSLGRDLTELARKGGIGPVIGVSANKAMGKLVTVLLMHETNNPILVAEPGMGKTAIVEALAWHLSGNSTKDIIQSLRDKRIIQISVVDLIADTRYRGELEERVKRLVLEVKSVKDQVIIFIDEIHMILGGSSFSSDTTVANILKPALARGEFPCIGATTVGEYRNHIEKDHALARRFTPIWLDEPTIDESLEIVRQVANSRLIQHYGSISFEEEAIIAAVKLSARYLFDRKLPGKAISLLDEAASTLSLGPSFSIFVDQPLNQINNRVTREAVLEVLSTRTNIPVKRLNQTDLELVQGLEERLQERVKGQNNIIVDIVKVIKRSSFGSRNSQRPLGVFLFAGPSGVGKTSLAITLAEAIFGSEKNFFRVDMSEFMEKHQVSRLIGSPPGYIGSEQEGQLTGYLRRTPNCVVLFDEIDKAHWDVIHLFLQLFDYGRLTDSHGNVADGRNAIFIMTTNLGPKEEIISSDRFSYLQTVKFAVTQYFSSEFLNRIDHIAYFNHLDKQALMTIFDQNFSLSQALFKEKGLEIQILSEIKEQIVEYIMNQNMGARPLQRFIEREIELPIIDKILSGEIKHGVVIIGEDINIKIPKQEPKDLPQSKALNHQQLIAIRKRGNALQNSNLESPPDSLSVSPGHNNEETPKSSFE